MRHESEELKFLQSHWADAPVPAGLAERIIRHARSQPQWQPWWERLTVVLGNWQVAWAYKGPALAAIAVLGLLGGQLTAPAHPTPTTGISWTEGL